MSMKEFTSDRTYFNIVKGIGILSVVCGHAVYFTRGFVYVYHLPLFFFLAGFFYNETRYGDNPLLLMQRKMKSNWLPYVLLLWFFVLLHNPLYQARMLRSFELPYTKAEIIEKLCDAIFGTGDELFAGPLWFLPVLVLSVLIFGTLVTIGRFLSVVTKRAWAKQMFLCISVLILTVVFYPIVADGAHYIANIQFSFLVLPYLWCGYELRTRRLIERKHFLHPVAGIICILLTAWIGAHYFFDMTLAWIYPWMYAAALVGIYACLTAAKYLRNVKILGNVFAFYGEHSLVLLCMHYPVLRLIDVILCQIAGDPDGALYDHLPVSFEKYWWLYLLLTLPLTALFSVLYDRVKKGCVSFYERKKSEN